MSMSHKRVIIDSGSVVGLTTTPTTLTVVGVDMTVSNTEYSYTFLASCKGFTMILRDRTKNWRIATVTGKVAGSVDPYVEMPAGTVYEETGEFAGKTLYFAASFASQRMQIIYRT